MEETMKFKLNPSDLANPDCWPKVRVNIKLNGYKYDGCDKTFHIKDDKSLWSMVGYLQAIKDKGGNITLSD